MVKKKAKRSGSNRLASPLTDSKIITPVKQLSSSQNKPKKSSRSKSRKEKPLEISQGDYSSRNLPFGLPKSPTEDTPSSHTFTGKFGIPATFSSDSTKKLITSISSNGIFLDKTHGELFVRLFDDFKECCRNSSSRKCSTN